MWSRLLTICAMITLIGVNIELHREIKAQREQLTEVQRSLTAQSNAILAAAKDSQERLQHTSDQLADLTPSLNVGTKIAEKYLNLHPLGATECDRSRYVDQEFLGTLKAGR